MDKDAASLWDMYQALLKIEKFTRNLTRDHYESDDLVQSAVERQFEILGEAARRVSEKFKDAHPDIPWRNLIGQRNVIAHQYDKIDHERLWVTIKTSCPQILETLEAVISQLKKGI